MIFEKETLFFSKTVFLCVVLVLALELALVGESGLEITEIVLSLHLECWD